MILDLTEEQREYLLPILLEEQETEINRPDIDVGKLELIEELIEKVESGTSMHDVNSVYPTSSYSYSASFINFGP